MSYDSGLTPGGGGSGTPGPPGVTPHIGDNGNWWTGDTDTGIAATGPKGDAGAPGGGSGPVGSTAAGIGDSRMAKGFGVSNGVTYPFAFDQGTSLLLWMHLNSGGRIRLGRPPVAAHGGWRSQELMTDYQNNPATPALVPQFLSLTESLERPAYALVLMGANDYAQSVSVATYKANMIAAFNALRAAGITPIVCLDTPRNNVVAGGANGYRGYNAWLRHYARTQGLMMIDFHTPLVDPATNDMFKTGLNIDNIHPNDAGYRIMGRTAAEALLAQRPDAWLPVDFASANLLNVGQTISMHPNPLFLTDTNSDGLPDGWTGTNGTTTLTSDSEALGNWMTVTRTGGADAIRRGPTWTPIAGHTYRLTTKLRTNVVSSGGQWELFIADSSDFAGPAVKMMSQTQDTDPGAALCVEFTAPNPVTPAGGYWRLNARVTGADGASIALAQTQIDDLTAAGAV